MSEGEMENIICGIKQHSRIIRKTRFYRSRLDRVSDVILGLYNGGANIAEIKRYLRSKHRLHVHHSTISRWLRKHRHG